LVLSAPTKITFSEGYMSKAIVYRTDQDRDPSNDLMIQEVGKGGIIALMEGAYTVRR
jgi:hypothetical protein